MSDSGIRVVLTPVRAPNANAYAERFVRSIKEECLDRLIPMGERHFCRAVREFVAHYHGERNHQGLQNRLIQARRPSAPAAACVDDHVWAGCLTITNGRRDHRAPETWNTTRHSLIAHSRTARATPVPKSVCISTSS